MSGIRGSRGLSLIELMVALVIGSILMLGVVQVFGASRATYQLTDGMSRAQENGRFAMDFLQRDVRMAGHFGCVNDQAHAQKTPSGLHSTFSAAPHPGLYFDMSIQGFEADGTAPGETVTISSTPDAGSTDFEPALPAQIAAATGNRIAGSDILVLRFLAPEGVPVTAIGGTLTEPEFTFDNTRWDVLRSGVGEPGLFGVADCLHTTVFQASAVEPGKVTVAAGAELNASTFTTGYTDGQSFLHRAESVVYYVGRNEFGGTSLYRLRFTAGPDEALGTDLQEMVEGVENLQLLFGQDRVVDPTKPPSGFIDRRRVASEVTDGTTAGTPDAWRRVGSVQIGLLTASPDRAAASQAEDGNELRSVGVVYSIPADGRYRAVYQTTVALRNRLYGN